MNDQSSISRAGATAVQQTVSASDLVRQFGLWQDVAAHEPVYILNRGRARLVLASVEIMSALCAPHTGDRSHFEARETALLDAISEPAAIVDANFTLMAIGRAARGYFGERALVGVSLTNLLPVAVSAFVLEAIRRTIASGFGETIELTDDASSGRRLEVEIVPHPAGALLVGHDRTVEDARDEAQASTRAIAAALGELHDIATARIGLRGYLTSPDAALARLTGVGIEAQTSVRFVTLFDVGSRVAVGDAIESVIANGRPIALRGRLLVAGSAVIDARVSLAAVHRGVTVVGVLAVIAAA